MTIAVYNSTSPYYSTPQVNQLVDYLDFWDAPNYVPSLADTPFVVTSKYQYRPDLLSYDIYGTTGYWWIFLLRNPDVLKDPVYDLRTGITIYLPAQSSLPHTVNNG